MKKIIIAGSRSFNDYKVLCERCDEVFSAQDNNPIVVSGGAKGADLMGEKYASDRGYGIRRFPADWVKHGNSAGPIRNVQMAEYADGLIAFWDGESAGTKNMIDNAKKKGLEVLIVLFKKDVAGVRG